LFWSQVKLILIELFPNPLGDVWPWSNAQVST